MIYQGRVDLPGGRKVYGRAEVQYDGSVQEWWRGGGRYLIDYNSVKLTWEDGKELSEEEKEKLIRIEYEISSRVEKLRDFVLEQMLILGGEPYDTSR